MSKIKCSDCAFFAPHKDPERGDCRRRPPTLILTKELSKSDLSDDARYLWSDFPATAANAWCGEFRTA